MGGLTAAIKLARSGFNVRVIEAREHAGGLASGFEKEGFAFDAGPYILLDRPGLEWAFRALDLDLTELIPMRRIEDVYEVSSPESPSVRRAEKVNPSANGLFSAVSAEFEYCEVEPVALLLQTPSCCEYTSRGEE